MDYPYINHIITQHDIVTQKWHLGIEFDYRQLWPLRALRMVRMVHWWRWQLSSNTCGTRWCPPSYVCWFITPWKLVRYITNKNHSYWSYLHQLSYRTGATLCTGSNSWNSETRHTLTRHSAAWQFSLADEETQHPLRGQQAWGAYNDITLLWGIQSRHK